MKFILTIVMVLGGFVMNAPTPVIAVEELQESTMAHDATQEESMSCSGQGCTREHDACQTHCISQSTKHVMVAAFVISSSDFTPAIASVRETNFHTTAREGVLISIPNRAPPTQKLLRSVMKRE